MSEDSEVSLSSVLMGVTVRRAPINYVGPKVEEKPKEKTPRKTLTTRVTRAKVEKPPKPKLTDLLTPEQIKKRKAERALHWYNERKNNPELLEKRRQYAKEYHAKKNDK